MPENDPDHPTTQNPSSSPSDAEAPLIDRFQNYKNLKQQLGLGFANSLPEFMDRGFSPDFIREQSLDAAAILAPRTIRYLPENTEITQEVLTDSILSAQNELIATEDWFDIALPSRKKREKLAQAIASGFDVKDQQQQVLQAAVSERSRYAKEALENIPKQETVSLAIQSQLETAGLTEKESQLAAVNALSDYERNALRYGAAPPTSQLEMFIGRELRKRGIDDYREASKNIVRQTEQQAIERAQAIAFNRKKIAKDLNLKKTVFKHARKLDRFKKLNKTLGKVEKLGKVLHPIRSVKKAVGKRIAIAGGKLAAKLMTKVGLGGIVKYAQEAALAASGIGLPLAIIEEVALAGVSRLIKTVKQSSRELKETIQTGFQNPLKGSLRAASWGIDTAGGAVGGGVGAAIGTVGGAFLGATIGSIIPVFGTVIGGVLGGVVGGLAGGGFGAKFGYNLRRKLIKKIKRAIVMKLFISSMLAAVKAALANIALGAAIGGAIGTFILPGIGTAVGAAIGGWLGGKLKIAENIQNLAAQAKNLFTGEGIKTAFSRVAVGTNNFFTTLGEYISSGQGVLAQSIRGVGRIIGKIPSSIARAFNQATGWVGNAANTLAGTTDALASQILTAGPGAEVVGSTVYVAGGVVAFTTIFYFVLISAFFVHPTEVDPFYEDPSRFIDVSKSACIGTRCTTSTMQLENPTEAGPYNITYIIEVEAVDRTLTNVTIQDLYSSFGRYQDPNKEPEAPPAPAALEWNGGITLAPGEIWTPPEPVTVTIPAATIWDDALLSNRIVVTATIEGFGEQENADSVTFIFGNPPFCPPHGDPEDPGYSFRQPYRPGAHTGVDIANGIGSPIYSSFPCQAEVVYAGMDTYHLGQFGYYVALRSGTWYTFSAHMINQPDVSVGDIVGFGTVLGHEGSTGNSTGPHLHYEIRDGTLGSVNENVNWQPSLTVDPCNGFGLSGCP